MIASVIEILLSSSIHIAPKGFARPQLNGARLPRSSVSVKASRIISSPLPYIATGK